MFRIFLPLAVVAALYFGPLYSYPSDNPVSGQSEVSTVAGDKFVGGVINCVRKLEIPLGEECASDAVINDSSLPSHLLSLATVGSIGAALISVIGILPFLGRITSIFTLGSGLVSLSALGVFVVTMMGTESGLPAVQWGAYLAAGLALLTTISGLSGMRGR